MAILTTTDALVDALASGQKRDFFKASATAEGAGTWHSLWNVAGQPRVGGSAGVMAGLIPVASTPGAIPFASALSGSTFLMQAVVAGATVGKLIVYDRLWHNSGMSGTVTAASNINSIALTRPDALGTNTELWGEIYTAIGATGATLSASYTNSSGTASRVATYVHPANAESVGQMFPLMLQTGDTGVRSIQQYIWSGTTGTAGNFGLTLLRRIAEIPINLANVGQVLDYAMLGLPSIYPDSCLALMVMCSATNTGVIQGSFVISN